MHYIRIDGRVARGAMLTHPGRRSKRDDDCRRDYRQHDELARGDEPAHALHLQWSHVKSIVHTSSPIVTPTAVQAARWKGIKSLNVVFVRTTRVMAAPMTPINAQNIQAGKKAPNSSNEGAPAIEQPVSMQLARAGGITLDSVVKYLIRSLICRKDGAS